MENPRLPCFKKSTHDGHGKDHSPPLEVAGYLRTNIRPASNVAVGFLGLEMGVYLDNGNGKFSSLAICFYYFFDFLGCWISKLCDFGGWTSSSKKVDSPPMSIGSPIDLFNTLPIHQIQVYTHLLIGGFNHLENYQSMGRIIPYIMENIKCSKPPTSIYMSLKVG